MEIGGRREKVAFLCLILPPSDVGFVKAYPRETSEACLSGHVSALALLGGVARSILYDNTTRAVARILGDGTRQRTRAFAHLQSHYLFRERFGRPGKGNDKGKVEALVKTAQRKFLVPTPKAHDLSVLNERLLARCLERLDALEEGDRAAVYSRGCVHFGQVGVASLSDGIDEAEVNDAEVPLVVDVDGTLVASDLLVEGLLRLVASSPLGFLRSTVHGLRGRAALKRAISLTAPLPPSSLVLNPAVVEYIKAAKRSGRPVWPASGADELAVEPLAKLIGANGLLASDGRLNLVGKVKAEALVELFGDGGFDYVGNDRRDLRVWRHARRAVSVGASARLARRVRNLDGDATFIAGVGRPLDYLKALRPHHCVKNALVFVAPVAAHAVEAGTYVGATGAFFVLSLIASSAYIFNDMVDIGHDREHPLKRQRPLASGKVRFLPMTAIGTVLAAGGIGASFLISTSLGACAVLYFVLAVTYSLWLKRAIVIDVIVLASLYIVRVIAGGAAVAIPVSPWLLAFSMFIFVSLAIVKRRKELANVAERRQQAIRGRGYIAEDAGVMMMFGAASAIGAVIVLTMYVQAPEVATRYDRPQFLWLACPLLLYWLGRLLLLADRGAVDDDPVMFALQDRASWATGFLFAAVVAIAL